MSSGELGGEWGSGLLGPAHPHREGSEEAGRGRPVCRSRKRGRERRALAPRYLRSAGAAPRLGHKLTYWGRTTLSASSLSPRKRGQAGPYAAVSLFLCSLRSPTSGYA